MKIDILGVAIDSVTKGEALNRLQNLLYSRQPHYVVTPNPEFIMAAQKDKEFKEILNNASLALPDGIGLKLAARYLKTPLKERITGIDIIWKIAELAQDEKAAMYLYGAGEGVAKRAAQRLQRKYSDLKIVGTESGLREGVKIPDQEIIDLINKNQPKILLVALGFPKQEKWIVHNLPKLNSVKVAVGVGGSFDYLARKVPRAPKLMRILGMEWLFRLIIQPWRINRIITATIRFSKAVIKFKRLKNA